MLLPTAAFSSLVPAVPPTRLSAEVPVAEGDAAGAAAGALLGLAPDSVPVVTGPRLGLWDSLRPSSAI